MAIVGSAVQQPRTTTFIIGDNIPSINGTIAFINPPPKIGIKYYIFIRVYSSLNVSQIFSIIIIFA